MKKQLLIIGLMITAQAVAIGQSTYCGGVIAPSSSTAFIYIYQGTPLELNGETLEYGSSIIAVYQDSNGDWQCAGETQWWGYNTILNVRGADSEIEGYEEGATYKFYVQLPDDCILKEVEVDFLVNAQFPAGDTYTQAGKSRLSSLSATFAPSLEVAILADTCGASTGQVAIDNISGVDVANIFWPDGQEGLTANGLAAGIISAQITTTEGCTFSSSFEVPTADCPFLQCTATCNGFTEGDQGCAPFTTVFSDNSFSESGIQSYFWDFGDGNTSTEASPTHIYTEPGTYTVEFTIMDAYQEDSQIFEIVVHPSPIASWNYIADICQPQIITFIGESPDNIENWNWSFSDGQSINTSSASVDFGNTGILINGTLEVIDDNSCTTEFGLEVNVPEAYDLEIISETIQHPSCMEPNGHINVVPTGGTMPFNYTWQHEPANHTDTASTLFPGEYTVSVIDGNGCQDSLMITLEDNTEVPSPSLGEDITFCINEPAILNAGVSSGSFQWYINDMPINGANNSTYSPSQSGIYSVEVSNIDNCIGSDTIMVDLLEIPIIDLGDDQSLCPTQTVTLDAFCSNCSYQWSNGNTTASIEAIPGNDYSVTVSNADNCMASDSITISSLPEPIVSLGDDQTICEGTSVIIGVAEEAGNLYNWSSGNTTSQVEVTTSGQYILSITNAESCIQSDSISISFMAQPNASIFASEEQICAGETLQLNAEGGDTYIWIDTSFSITIPDQANVAILPSHTTEYGLIASNECDSDTAYITIQVSQPYILAPADTCIAIGKDVSLEAPPANSYNWWQTDQDIPLSTNSILTISPDTTTLYYLQMTDTFNCTFLDSILVSVLELESLELEPVEIITPNGDGYNDVLFFSNITKFTPRTLSVFNRWGGLVYDSFNYQNDWDGTRNGEPLPAGVYYYVLRIGQHELKHSLTIIYD